METTLNKTATNDLRHSILAHDAVGNPIYIKIRLNDECHNGHQDFSITGDMYEKGKPKSDRYHICGGCIHEEIVKARPDLKIFIDLHLCDYKGIPIYAVANGFYHLRQGFNNTKPENPSFKTEYCEYYRLTDTQFEALNRTVTELQFAVALDKEGILAQWERQANEAIKLLEEMTGKAFVVDSKKTQYNAPTPDELAIEEEKQRNGYYTPEAAQQREEAKRQGILDKLMVERDKDIDKANTEFEVKKQVLLIGGEAALNNCIFYDHTNVLAFNWKSYDTISSELINKIISEANFPDGVTIKNENK